MYCNNCGGKGHVFKICSEPITSCGLILIDKSTLPTNPKDVRVLMVRRKDSMAYTEFLRGKYKTNDEPYIKKLLSNMTVGEQTILCTTPFDDLWTSHWGTEKGHHSQEYESSKERFASIDIASLVASVSHGFSETEWGFPKGRRVHRESDMDCALREFSEETNITRDSFIICKNLVLTESFNGTNGVHYKHVYFVCLLVPEKELNLKKKMTSMQKCEISGIDWKTIKQCRMLTRPHYTQRSEMLDSLERALNTFDLQDNVVFKQE